MVGKSWETTVGNQVGPKRERETDRGRQEKHIKTNGGENGM